MRRSFVLFIALSLILSACGPLEISLATLDLESTSTGNSGSLIRNGVKNPLPKDGILPFDFSAR
jgi:hypothetical protein